MDMTQSIAPRSDQLNAEDLLSGAQSVTIVSVSKGSAEQPVNVVLDEFGPGRPFRPCKTVRRIMVAAWGPDTTVYPGRRMTLYRDPTVRFGGEDVGGIRVSHLSHLPDDKPLRTVLTVTRGKRAPFIVQPLTEAASPTREPIPNLAALSEAFVLAGIDGNEQRMRYVQQLIRPEITSAHDLTAVEAQTIIDALKADAADRDPEDVQP